MNFDSIEKNPIQFLKNAKLEDIELVLNKCSDKYYNSENGETLLSDNVFDIIKDDQTVWETDTLYELAKNDQLYAHKHQGFWQPMDTLREKIILNDLWSRGKAPWKIW